MISESQIEAAVDALQHTDLTKDVETLLNAQLIAYISTEIVNNLLEDEQGVLEFCLTVIAKTIQGNEGYQFDIDKFFESEERNWANRDKSTKWEDSVNAYFADYPEEDLLAFVEDMLVEDEDQSLSTVGQEIIFISCKSFIDAHLN